MFSENAMTLLPVNPLSIPCNFQRLRTNSPAPASNTRDSATWVITRRLWSEGPRRKIGSLRLNL